MVDFERKLTAGGRQRGQALAEFALAIPILVLIILAIFEGAAFIFTYTTVERAAQDGGRFAALPGPDTADVDGDGDTIRDHAAIRAYVLGRADSALAALVPGDITITVNGCATEACYTSRLERQRVNIAVAYEYVPITAQVFGSGVTFAQTAVTEYRVE